MSGKINSFYVNNIKKNNFSNIALDFGYSIKDGHLDITKHESIGAWKDYTVVIKAFRSANLILALSADKTVAGYLTFKNLKSCGVQGVQVTEAGVAKKHAGKGLGYALHVILLNHYKLIFSDYSLSAGELKVFKKLTSVYRKSSGLAMDKKIYRISEWLPAVRSPVPVPYAQLSVPATGVDVDTDALIVVSTEPLTYAN